MGLHAWRQQFFANYFTNSISDKYSEALNEEKEKLFSELKKQTSVIPEYKTKGSIKIVELGAGPGPNLEYFPEKCHLTVVDPNHFFQDKFQENLAKCPGITLEGYIQGYGEDMKEHIADASVDAVVATAVFCSVKDIQKVYKEIQRILVPGGKFYYIEHIQGEPGSWSYYLQKVMAATHFWQFINCDCNIDRNLDHLIALAGFSKIEQRLFRIDTSAKFGFHFIAPHVTGIALK